MVLPTKIGDPPLKMAGRSKNEKVLGFVLLQELLLVGWYGYIILSICE